MQKTHLSRLGLPSNLRRMYWIVKIWSISTIWTEQEEPLTNCPKKRMPCRILKERIPSLNTIKFVQHFFFHFPSDLLNHDSQVVSFSKLTRSHISDMGITAESLDHDRLNRILQVFDSFQLPIQFSEKQFSEKQDVPILTIFEPFWLNLVKDGRFINDFKVVKKNIGKKVALWLRLSTH